MKIAFIGQKGIPARSGGVEKHVEQLAIRMAAAGHDVFVYARGHYTKTGIREYRGVKLIYLPSIATKNLDTITHTLIATLHALFQRYDILHYQSIGPTTLSVLPRLFNWRTRVLTTFHTQDYEHKKWSRFAKLYLRFGEWITCRVPEQTIVVSRGLAEYVAKHYKRQAILIPNGATVGTTAKTDTLAALGLKEKRYALSVSRLVEHKGIHYLIQAFKELEDTNRLANNFKLAIVGKDAETPEYARYLKMISKGRKNVLFLGERTGKELEQLFSHASLFVQPSESEGLSIALLEAMGHSVPVLVSDIEANREAVGEAGIIFENKNIEDLRGKLASILNRPGEALELGKKGAEWVYARYSWDTVAAETLSVYGELLDAKGGQLARVPETHHFKI